ncbi:odorant receptor 131-2-like [Menidia menidia]
MTNRTGTAFLRQLNDKVIFVQVFGILLLCINFMLITTFFKREIFYRIMRYILFANTLFSDCILLVITNMLLVLNFFDISIQTGICFIVFTLSSLCNFVTPITLTAMSLERYVAICMPLRHAELCSTGRALQSLLIIYCVSFIPSLVILLVFFFSASLSFFKRSLLCSAETFIVGRWHGYIRSAVSQSYFLLMCIAIAFSYVQIMKVATAASGENKKSTQKGLKTVALHAFQLLLCLIQLVCPFIEAAVLQVDFSLFINVRYVNYILFSLAPRCLSPLIYGLRDETFFLALKYYIFWCPLKNNLKPQL